LPFMSNPSSPLSTLTVRPEVETGPISYGYLQTKS
jgi:hypothetical protein